MIKGKLKIFADKEKKPQHRKRRFVVYGKRLYRKKVFKLIQITWFIGSSSYSSCLIPVDSNYFIKNKMGPFLKKSNGQYPLTMIPFRNASKVTFREHFYFSCVPFYLGDNSILKKMMMAMNFFHFVLILLRSDFSTVR